MSQFVGWTLEWVVKVLTSILLLCMALFLLPFLPFEHFFSGRSRRGEKNSRLASEAVSSSFEV